MSYVVQVVTDQRGFDDPYSSGFVTASIDHDRNPVHRAVDGTDVHHCQPILSELAPQIFSEVLNLVDVIFIEIYYYAEGQSWSLPGSAWRHLVLDHLAALHHKFDALQFSDVGEGVA